MIKNNKDTFEEMIISLNIDMNNAEVIDLSKE